jgi:hypothetical protein
LFFLDLVCLITAPVADGVSQALNPTLHMNDCRVPPNFTIYQAFGYDGQICIEHIQSKILGRLDDVSWAGDYFHPCMIRIPQIYPMWQSEHQFRQKWGLTDAVYKLVYALISGSSWIVCNLFHEIDEIDAVHV